MPIWRRQTRGEIPHSGKTSRDLARYCKLSAMFSTTKRAKGEQNWSMGSFVTILNPRNEVLCVQQAYAEQNWTTPGGQIEDGEDPIEAVMRETLEEVGIDISNLTFSGLYWKSYARDLVFSFMGTSDLEEFNFRRNPEISQAAFFSVEMLPSPMAKNTQVRIKDAAIRAAPRLTIFLTPDQFITR